MDPMGKEITGPLAKKKTLGSKHEMFTEVVLCLWSFGGFHDSLVGIEPRFCWLKPLKCSGALLRGIF